MRLLSAARDRAGTAELHVRDRRGASDRRTIRDRSDSCAVHDIHDAGARGSRLRAAGRLARVHGERLNGVSSEACSPTKPAAPRHVFENLSLSNVPCLASSKRTPCRGRRRRLSGRLRPGAATPCPSPSATPRARPRPWPTWLRSSPRRRRVAPAPRSAAGRGPAPRGTEDSRAGTAGDGQRDRVAQGELAAMTSARRTPGTWIWAGVRSPVLVADARYRPPSTGPGLREPAAVERRGQSP